VPVLGRYIGETGLHFTPEVFRECGYHLTQPFPAEAPLEEFDVPDEAALQAMLAASLAAGRALCGVPQAEQRSWPLLPLPLEAEALVTLLYRALLDREPDGTGLAHFAGTLREGLNRPEQVVQALLRSDEFVALHGARLAARARQG
jgi:hypothetical protein